MAKPTSARIRRAWIQAVREVPAYAQTDGIYHGIAPGRTEYPFLVFNVVAAPYEDDWSSRTVIVAMDLIVYSANPVEADNLDEAFADALDGAQLTVEGMTTLICRRVADVPSQPDVDEKGARIYGVGGTYEIWTSYPL